MEQSHSAAYYPMHRLYIWHTGLSDCSSTKHSLVWGWLLPSLEWRGRGSNSPSVCKDIALWPWRESSGGVMSVLMLVEAVLLQKNLKINILGDRQQRSGPHPAPKMIMLSSLLASGYLLLILESDSGCFGLVTRPWTTQGLLSWQLLRGLRPTNVNGGGQSNVCVQGTCNFHGKAGEVVLLSKRRQSG